MCCLALDAVRELGKALQCLLCLLCVVLCGGPVLIIVGIVLLASPNNRSANISAYNAAVASYNSQAPLSWNGTIAGQSISNASSTVIVTGDTTDVTPAVSNYVQVYVPWSTGMTSVTYWIKGVIQSFSVQLSQQITISVSCTSTYCTSNCNNGGTMYCSASAMQSACANMGYSYTSGTGCSSSSSCQCQGTRYLSIFCVTAVSTPFSFTSSACKYPFSIGTQTYVSQPPSSITFQLRAADDPYVALQRILQGSTSFGISAAQQTGIGIGLLIAGIVIVLLLGLIFYLIYRCCIAGKKQGSGNNPPPANYPMAAPPPNYPAPAQPYPAAAPPPGYPAPPPAYPPQGYPAPAPAYPPQGYPAPAPAYPPNYVPQPAPSGYPNPALGYPQPLYPQPV